MASIHKTLGIVLAGGQGTRLHALTHARCKPAVPFNGKHRLVDFVLSNLLNSGLRSVQLLVQYQAQSLAEHVRQAWTSAPYLPPHFLNLLPPAPTSEHGYLGTSDAVWQHIRVIEEAAPDHVAVFGADHVYRMDLRQMLEAHVRDRADVTVATVPVPCERCSGFGTVEADAQLRITDFPEKPQQARGMASMGNHLFSTDVLLRELHRSAAAGETGLIRRSVVGSGCVIGAGASLRRVIVDQDNHIPPGERIGHDEAFDRMRFHVSPGGVVVVPRGHFRRPA